MQNPSLYDDNPDGGETPPAAEPSDSKESSAAQTTLVPKAVFGGRDLKPGDKCDVEVVRVHEDAYEVQGCEGGEHESEQPAEAPMPASSDGAYD